MSNYYQEQIAQLQKEITKVAATVATNNREISELVETMATINAEAVTRIAAVRALHTADRDNYCTHCRGRKWPCPTFKATDGITT